MIKERLPFPLHAECEELFAQYLVDEDEIEAFEASYEKITNKNFKKFEAYVQKSVSKNRDYIPPEKRGKKRKDAKKAGEERNGENVDETNQQTPNKVPKVEKPKEKPPAIGYVVTAGGAAPSDPGGKTFKLQFQKEVSNAPFGQGNTTVNVLNTFTSLDVINMKPEERAAAIEERIEEFRQRLAPILPFPEGEIGMTYRDTTIFLGRLLCEAEGKLNEQSMLLEGSRKTSNGTKVRLRVEDRDKELKCFSGQIVAAVGKSDSMGHTFYAREFIELPIPPPMPPKGLPSQNRGTRVVTACGPFSAKNEVDFSPLFTILIHTHEENADVLVLIGPFIDKSNPLIQRGALLDENRDYLSIEEIYVRHIIPPIEEFLGEFKGKLLIVPSPDEVLYFYPSIPQPPLDVATEDLWGFDSEGVIFGSNPCFAEINGALCCFTSQDIVAPLVKDLIFTNAELKASRGQTTAKVNKTTEAMRMILEQRSLFPNQRPPVDCSRRNYYEFFDNIPSVFIFPSQTGRGYLAQMVEDRFFINPGTACKVNAVNTFADFMISADPKQCRCDIVKL